MTELSRYLEVGVDLGKESFDASTGTTSRTWSNCKSGIGRFLDHFHSRGEPFRITCEATGGYPRRLVLECLRRNIPVSLVNARNVRNFARAAGLLAKTDAIDARVVARYAATFDPPTLDASWEQEESLRQFLQRLEALIEARARCKTSLEYYSEARIRAEIRREIAALTRRIKSYESTINALIDQDEAMRQKREVLTRTTGVGPAVSRTLIITFPELGSLNRNQAAALAGLAPMNRDSGKARGKRTIQAGRAKPRRALYMAALTAAHRNPIFIPQYQKLIARGKPVKVALTAIARKLLIYLNTQLKAELQMT